MRLMQRFVGGGERSLGCHSSEINVFGFFADKPYRIGKLYGNGIECYDAWHPELERFFETNYVLICKGSDLERLCRRAGFDISNVAIPGSG